jgi:putative ABC transport system permease protein
LSLLLLTVAGGMGVVILTGSVADSILAHPLPYGGDPGRFVFVWFSSESMRRTFLTYQAFQELQQQTATFQRIAASQRGDAVLAGTPAAERVAGLRVSGEYFHILSVPPAIGRLIDPDDDRSGTNRVAVISHRLWMDRFGGDSSVLGRSILLDSTPYTVIGVTDRRLAMLKTDVWVPLAHFMISRQQRNSFVLTVRGQLRPGVSMRAAQSEVSQFALAYGHRNGDTNGALSAIVVRVDDVVVETVRAPVLRLFAGAIAVLVLCWLHLSSAFLVLALERVREAGVRLALGATVRDLLLLFLHEIGAIAVAGWLLAILLARAGLAYFVAHAPGVSVRFTEVQLSGRLVWGSLLLNLGTAWVVSRWLAVRLARLDVAQVIANAPPIKLRRAKTMRPAYVLLAVQIAITASVAICADYLLREYSRLDGLKVPFAAQAITARISLPDARYPTPGDRTRAMDRIQDELRRAPGIDQAAAVLRPPLALDQWFKAFEIEGMPARPGDWQLADYSTATAGYFAAVGISVLEGREFSERDNDEATPVVLIDENLATAFFPGQSALGKRLRLGGPADPKRVWRQVVGVVRHVRDDVSQQNQLRYQIYVPHAQDPWNTVALIVRSRRPYADTVGAIRRTVHQLDSELPVFLVSTLADLSNDSLSARLAATQLLGIFSFVGLALGVVGTYAVVSGSIAGRERELLIREAVGASPVNITLLITRETLYSVTAGVVLGGILMLIASKLLRSVWTGFGEITWVEYAMSLPVVAISATAACLAPSLVRTRRRSVASLTR